MTNLSENNKLAFCEFLGGYKSAEELENFIYAQSDLEQQLDRETYLDLISLNFKDKYIKAKLADLIKQRIIEEGHFETWKLKRVLHDFLTQPEKTDINLDKLYHLYCGTHQDNGQRKYEYKFLGNLGLNYLHWADEAYLRAHHGDNWEIEHKKCSAEFGFYHEQLKGFATAILSAIDNNGIEILNDGTYRITNELKTKLEADELYKLKHPGEKHDI